MTIDRDLARTILGIIGNVTSFLLFLSPAKTIWKIWKNKSVEEFQYHPIVAGVTSCAMWIIYSLPFVHPHSILVTTINSIGLAIYLVYNIIYFAYASKDTKKSMGVHYLGEVLMLAVTVCITLLALHDHTSRSKFVGILCDVFGVLLYASPLTAMFNVVTTNSVEYMPLPLSLAGFVNGLVWTAYALIRFDLYILIGNVIGVGLALIQLILYACYYKATPPPAVQQEGKDKNGLYSTHQLEA